MSSIMNFFKPTKKAGASSGGGQKRPASDSAASPTEKKSLSPEQAAFVTSKKDLAMRKLAITKGVPSEALMAPSWRKALEPEFSKPYFLRLKTFLETEKKNGKTIFPNIENVFSWSHACELSKVKVVILGQDPYHGPGQAHGLCFSFRTEALKQIDVKVRYKELKTDIPGFNPPKHGHLQTWADQGVLLLNAVLTVQKANANSHKDKGWETFTDAVIKTINTNYNNVVFILWGGYAQKKGKGIDKKKHHIITGPHPSPLSAHRGYFGSKHFSKTNAYLKSVGRSEINWKSVC
eukprot:gene1359-21701_t